MFLLTRTATYFIPNQIHYDKQIRKRTFTSDTEAASLMRIFKALESFQTCLLVFCLFFFFFPLQATEERGSAIRS